MVLGCLIGVAADSMILSERNAVPIGLVYT